jgi:hypothetical protein
MKRIKGTALVILALISLSCKSTRKTASATGTGNTATVSKKVACAEQVKESSQPHLDWIIEENSVLDNLTTLSRPSSYRVYSLDSLQLRAFFYSAKGTEGKPGNAKTVLPLPTPFECRTYALTESNAMSPKLREKYPDIVSLKGTDESGKADARLDYDGSKVRGQIMWNKEVYLISAVKNNGKTYYMVYLRSDSGDKKEPFEEQGLKPQKFDK